MITPEEAELLRMGPKGHFAPHQHKEKALTARLERAEYLRLWKPVDGSVSFTRTDLGYDALMQFEAREAEKAEQSTLSARLARSPANIWSILNSNLVVGMVSAIIGYVLVFYT